MEILTMSKEGTSEYCCNAVKIGEITPIPNRDKIATTVVNGEVIVIRKDQVREGDILFYASNECQLNSTFLSLNNLFEFSERDRNANAEEVNALIEEGKIDEAKSKVGYFNKYGRVRMIKLGGVLSMGYLFSVDELARFCPEVKTLNLEEILNKDFDTVNGELFVKAYVPPVKEKEHKKGSNPKKDKIEKFDRMIPGQFAFHYDTAPLQKNMYKISPLNMVTISVKMHGTSAIYSNIKTKFPIKLPWYKKVINFFKEETFPTYYIKYDVVYSSRKVIKNKNINPEVTEGYYKRDVWEEYYQILKDIIPQDVTLYGEICGYSGNTPIQKGYDYGCNPEENVLMIYRITTNIQDGKKYEWEPTEVVDYVLKLTYDHPELKNKIIPLPIIYSGTLKDLYPEVSTFEHWHEDILLKLQEDKNFFMEELEPMCNNKVPREGICLRINFDKTPECFKLKCKKFLEKEAKNIDKGDVDIEMINNSEIDSN